VAGFLITAGPGWGWPGLVHYFISHLTPDVAAPATGIVQIGSYIGSAVGPVLTGAVLALGSSTLAWAMLATMAAIAVTISYLAGYRLRTIGPQE
jgi:cyanate permease